MRRKIFAVFPGGATLKRGTTKDYTHAWRVCFRLPLNADGKPVNSVGILHDRRDHSESGFASSEARAHKAMQTRINVLSQSYEITAHDVAPVQVH